MIYLVQTTEKMKAAYSWLKSEPTLGADIETTGLDPLVNKTLLIQLGTPKHQCVFDMARLKEGDRAYIYKILEAPHILKVFQNGKFDYKFLKQDLGVVVKNMADTMITEQLLTKGVKMKGFGLGELAEKYRAGKLDKTIRKQFQEMEYGDDFTKEAIEYAADDVKVTPIIYHEQLKIAKERGMLKLVDLENQTVRVNAEMELNGIFINQDLWLDLEDAAIKERDDAEADLQKHFEPYYPMNLFGKLDINYGSWQQIKPALEKVMGIELESTNDKYLKQFNNSKNPSIGDLMRWRKASKKISTYGAEFLEHVHPISKRIHAKYLQLGTDSGRESCTNPNMQNIPHAQQYRTPFCVQDTDWRFISADFASQELRVLTQLSGEPAWLKAIEDGRDLHSMVASMMFKVPESECQKESPNDYRSKAKAIGFGVVYGMSAYGLSKTLEIEPTEAKQLLNKFFTSFPKIKLFLEERERITKNLKCAVSPLDGRLRDLGNIDWDDWRKRGHALNIGKNHPIQGASASITKLAMIKIQNYIEDNNKQAMIVAVIHDEILVECHKDIADEMADVVSTKMIEAFNHYCPDVPMIVKPDVGTHWIH
ncbi:MAG: hypothetical protein H8D23_17590 [Candidatus Brocadiales bacterium]|nr:hypothetical protein [Candidatus Brocadiales bacterium]